MVRCTFCDDDIERGTGIMFIKKDGKILHLCSKKCERNMLVLKRKPINVKWVQKKKKE